MLSRTARQLYRIGTLVEHAENVARLLDVNHRMTLGPDDTRSEADLWLPMISATRCEEPFFARHDRVTASAVFDFLLLADSYPGSVVSSLRAAREEARTVRDRISEEMWQHLNHMYLQLATPPTVDEVLAQGSAVYRSRIQLFCNTFHGLADNTMVRSASWNFLRLGRFAERAGMICRFLAVKHFLMPPEGLEPDAPMDLHQWEALLRSVSGYEAYRRLFRARIVPARVVDLLVSNPQFPRSVYYCLSQIVTSLHNLGRDGEAKQHVIAEVRAVLDDLRGGVVGDDIFRHGAIEIIRSLESRCRTIEKHLEESYFELLTVTDSQGRQRLISVQDSQQQQQRSHT